MPWPFNLNLLPSRVAFGTVTRKSLFLDIDQFARPSKSLVGRDFDDAIQMGIMINHRVVFSHGGFDIHAQVHTSSGMG